MTKASPTRREPAPTTPTPEELAEEGRADGVAPWTGPKADPELVVAAKDFMAQHDDVIYYLAHGEWAPTGPVEVQAALRELAGFLSDVASGAVGENVYESKQRRRVEALERRNDELEARIARLERDVVRRDHFDARIDELLQAVTSNA